MLDADAMQQWFDLFDAKLAVGCFNRDEFAAGKLLRRATFINVHVRASGEENRLIGFGARLQTENIRAGATKDKIDSYVSAKVFLKQLRRASRERVVAIGNNVSIVCGFDRLDDFRMNTRIVVARETALAHTFPALKSRAISRAAFAPGNPVRPPPGCVPAPHK